MTVVGVPTPFETVTGNEYGEAVPAGGVPVSTPVLALSVSQFGNVLVVVNELADGEPLVTIV